MKGEDQMRGLFAQTLSAKWWEHSVFGEFPLSAGMDVNQGKPNSPTLMNYPISDPARIAPMAHRHFLDRQRHPWRNLCQIGNHRRDEIRAFLSADAGENDHRAFIGRRWGNFGAAAISASV
ncbi:hypothetical protein OEZ49_01065 [Ruegeria sp. WL0004]|uniref:Uncharacterized protein n=1 Tax=Ruegeria marisflavi TaxID=2984152 RepID=A0ABT2WKB7_9RHOB|nr:hypothetical protein [Ruegeria sp. WL0004]MCU9836345.1 hypothetical protein [Ruegeria sp. WL0004]